MSLLPQTDFAIPEQTARVARTAFPKGNLYMQMRGELGTLFRGDASAPGTGSLSERLTAG